MSKQKIGMFNLLNQGGFVVRMDAQFRPSGSNSWTRVNLTSNILIDQSRSANPGEHGVPDGADVRLFADVEAGNDKIGRPIYTYKTGNNHVAKYAISGTAPDPLLNLLERT
jgi:hypothetical protein